MRPSLSFLLIFVLLVGCTSTPQQILTKINPLNWGSGRAAKKEAKAEAKQEAVRDELVQKAQVEVVKTGVALAVAQVENPTSRPIEVAKRTNENAAAILNQREPLDLATTQAALETARGLLSSETAAREKAEAAQKRSESDNRELASELATLKKDLAELGKKADAEAAKTLDMSRELNNQRFQKYGLMGLSALLSIGVFAYRMNIGRLQSGAAEVLAQLQKKHGDGVADTARGALDTILHTGEQRGVFKALTRLTGTQRNS